jgi:hypothetical protein
VFLSGGPVERHHRIRRRDGGDRLANLLLLRDTCHRWWTEHPDDAKARGIILVPGSDPEAEPVLHRGKGWVRLDDVGRAQRAQDVRPV